MSRPLDSILKIINQTQTFCLVIHTSPDGDTIGSALALASILEQLKKQVTIASRDPVPGVFRFLPKSQQIKPVEELMPCECLVTIDCGDLRKTGYEVTIAKLDRQSTPLINIDHHQRSDLHKLATITWCDESAAAVGVMIYELIIALGAVVDWQIATCLLTAIYTDTGGFQHMNTTPATLRLSAKLLALGARFNLITKRVKVSKTIPSLKLWGVALSRLRYDQELGIISSVVTQSDLAACSAQNDDLAGVVNLLSSASQAKAAILFAEQPDGKIKASLRTELDTVDVSRLANFFGGGGHKKASGFTLDGQLVINGDGKWELKLA